MGHSRTARVDVGLPRAATLDTTRVIMTVVLPLAARGLLLRRPPVVALAERLDLNRRAVHLLQRLRARYAPGPLRRGVPGRSVALVLSPRGVQRVLGGSPEPFAVTNREKRGALSTFSHTVCWSPRPAASGPTAGQRGGAGQPPARAPLGRGDHRQGARRGPAARP
jgi:hypothetical protein